MIKKCIRSLPDKYTLPFHYDIILIALLSVFRRKNHITKHYDGTGIGRSTLLAAERSFARDAGIEAFVVEMCHLLNLE